MLLKRIIQLTFLLGYFTAVPEVCCKDLVLSPADFHPVRRAGVIFPGKQPLEAVTASVRKLPGRYLRIEAEIEVPQAKPDSCDVYRLRIEQPGGPAREPITVPILSPVKPRRILVLEPFYEANPALPMTLRIERENGDPRNSCRESSALLSVRIIPMRKPDDNITVQPAHNYNSWPFIQTIGNKLVCAYSRGSAHTINEPARGVYARTSADGGKTWTEETLISNEPDGGEVTIGKGTDSRGAMLVWVRCAGKNWHHDLYRTEDGVRFNRIARIKPDPMPIQITDIFTVPGVGLMSLWFSGSYRNTPNNAWGTLVSTDDGKTWKQTVIESGLSKTEWPTEQSAVYLGGGRILAIARVEGGAKDSTRALFQLESEDSGKTWKRTRTNITDVLESTPSLILDRGRLYLYYFQRGTGQLKCRAADPDLIRKNPLGWPAPEIAALGSREWHHAGNVNSVLYGNSHCLAFYSGNQKDTAVVVKMVPAKP